MLKAALFVVAALVLYVAFSYAAGKFLGFNDLDKD